MVDNTYSLAANFSAHIINLDTFQRSITQSTIAQVLSGLQVNGDVVTVSFPLALSAGDKTTLDGIVAAHTGTPFASAPLPLRAVSIASQTSDLTTDSVAAAVGVGVGGLGPGDYLISFLCETATTAVVANTGVRAALQYDPGDGSGFADVYEDSWDKPQFHIVGGSAVVTLKAGDRPAIQLVWRRLGASSNPGIIRRIRMSIARAA